MAKKPKKDSESFERILASPDIKKAVEDFQGQVQVQEIRKVIVLLEDRIAQIEGRGEAAATNVRRLSENSVLQKRLAKFIARFCFRDNTPLEGLHADPDSRIDQAEMKALMIAAVQNCYAVIALLCGQAADRPGVAGFKRHLEMVTGTSDLLTALDRHDFNPEWDDPQD